MIKAERGAVVGVEIWGGDECIEFQLAPLSAELDEGVQNHSIILNPFLFRFRGAQGLII